MPKITLQYRLENARGLVVSIKNLQKAWIFSNKKAKKLLEKAKRARARVSRRVRF